MSSRNTENVLLSKEDIKAFAELMTSIEKDDRVDHDYTRLKNEIKNLRRVGDE